MHEVPAGRDPHAGGVRGRRPAADLLFVGEGPGEQEDLTGEPFVGRAGRLLTSLIEGIGLTRADVYIANVVKCRPPGNRDPQPARDRDVPPLPRGAGRVHRSHGRRDARQLRHQAAARRPRTASRSCAAGSSRTATAPCSSPRCTRRRCCAAAAPRSRRRAPTSSRSSARSRARRARDEAAHGDAHAPTRPHALGAAHRRVAARRRRRRARRRARHRQDRVRQGPRASRSASPSRS